jgi:hypothetical protein
MRYWKPGSFSITADGYGMDPLAVEEVALQLAAHA